MPVQERRERERAQRHRLIIDTARRLAEAEGWEAVTTRRLADEIEYSQPVLYSHFKGKDAIVEAVALDGIAELASVLQKARAEAPDGEALEAVVRAYVDFADANPVLYDAVFARETQLPFGTPEAPEPLRAAFGEMLAVFSAGPDSETRTEVAWSALHGLVTLNRDGRLRPAFAGRRLDLLVALLAKP
ncbi:TetR/AcrR family transcriptional regulator [Amycolatopsis acidicola]|uniref:TetR/AcrR family transcriptional regulator n=1 Tax=Amycolatopsis acidicola TaxID=2596893 RepID=A0A5N0UKS3_9PSEU|nr:TetR/AcrR family transcriptional regulator [Amycolatopsis acidicola]KAA9147866.1 TetR/AcrR family transcriptional regulator [Amycolatopsis acidicola]